jgi:intracellular septation protein A
VLKYGAILALSGFFFAYFSQGVAQIATLAMVLAIIMLSLIATYVRRRKVENASGPA